MIGMMACSVIWVFALVNDFLLAVLRFAVIAVSSAWLQMPSLSARLLICAAISAQFFMWGRKRGLHNISSKILFGVFCMMVISSGVKSISQTSNFCAAKLDLTMFHLASSKIVG